MPVPPFGCIMSMLKGTPFANCTLISHGCQMHSTLVMNNAFWKLCNTLSNSTCISGGSVLPYGELFYVGPLNIMFPSSLGKAPLPPFISPPRERTSVPLSDLIVNANCYLLAQMQMIGQPKWNSMMSELPHSPKLKKWNKRKMKWGEEGLNGGFLMGKAKLRLIYAAAIPCFSSSSHLVGKMEK